MAKYSELDFIILGGGCSALSLAMQISKNNINKFSFLLLESRTKYKDDRSWCFWLYKKNTLKKLISKSWESFSISYNKNR